MPHDSSRVTLQIEGHDFYQRQCFSRANKYIGKNGDFSKIKYFTIFPIFDFLLATNKILNIVDLKSKYICQLYLSVNI